MLFSSLHKTEFQRGNVLGIPKGAVFGHHHPDTKGRKVPTFADGSCDGTRIIWPDRSNPRFRHMKHPLLMPDAAGWGVKGTPLYHIEEQSGFPIYEHTRTLITELPHRPVVLDWGCGLGIALETLVADPEIRKHARLFGYSDTWYEHWNDIKGVKFLFFVKEHLPEYFRRTHIWIDFVFSHASLDTMLHDNDLTSHLRALASVMREGAIMLIPSVTGKRPELHDVEDVFDIRCGSSDFCGPYVLTKR